MWAKEGEGQWKGQKETEVSETLCEFDKLGFLGSNQNILLIPGSQTEAREKMVTLRNQ